MRCCSFHQDRLCMSQKTFRCSRLGIGQQHMLKRHRQCRRRRLGSIQAKYQSSVHNNPLKVGFISPFVVDDPTDLGATFVVAQALCLSIFNLSPMQKTCLFTNGNKANVSVCKAQSYTPLYPLYDPAGHIVQAEAPAHIKLHHTTVCIFVQFKIGIFCRCTYCITGKRL